MSFVSGDRVRLSDYGQSKLGWDDVIGVVHSESDGGYNVMFDGDTTTKFLYTQELSLVDESVESDNVKRPNHYQFGGVQVLDIVKYLPFPEGNVIKYVARADRKGNKIEDLHKAREYLDLAIEIAEAKDESNT